MSQPKNHHYISQTHIKKFFNEISNSIFIYDKQFKVVLKRSSSRKIFSEENLNTMLTEDGFDYKTVENHYNINFENDFNKHFQAVTDYINTNIIEKKTKDSLIFFAQYGAIANTRNPNYKKNIDDALFNALQPYYEGLGTEKQIEEFYKYMRPFGDKKFSNSPNSLEIAQNILRRMGRINFIIFTPSDPNDFFVLPDYCSLTIREKINSYLNPDIEEISIICFPLSSKIYLELYSEKSMESPKVSGVLSITSEQTELLNRNSLIHSKKIVACENNEYLEKLVKKFIN